MANRELNFETHISVRLDPRWKEVEKKLQQVVALTAMNIVKQANDDVPVKTGDLKGSIFVEKLPSGREPFVPVGTDDIVWRIGATMDYAPYVEFGTIYWKGKPFLIPAFNRERGRLTKAISAIMDELS